jgi:hypothetical protein
MANILEHTISEHVLIIKKDIAQLTWPRYEGGLQVGEHRAGDVEPDVLAPPSFVFYGANCTHH